MNKSQRRAAFFNLQAMGPFLVLRHREPASQAVQGKRHVGSPPASTGSHHQAAPGGPPTARLRPRQRKRAAGRWRWLAAALDELDYGIVLVFDGLNVVHINDAARIELDDKHPLQLQGDELRRSSRATWLPPRGGDRCVGPRDAPSPVPSARTRSAPAWSIIPPRGGGHGAAGRARRPRQGTVCESLSVQGFRGAITHGR